MPSGLLIAVTAHISTDVAAAPLLWVIPLSLYLLTWVVVFARAADIFAALHAADAALRDCGVVALILYSGHLPLIPNLLAHLLAFFVIATACHGELARSRPAPAHLTAFYVSLSFGGMLGGLFSGLFAPYAFLLDRRISDPRRAGGAVPAVRAAALARGRALDTADRSRNLAQHRTLVLGGSRSSWRWR